MEIPIGKSDEIWLILKFRNNGTESVEWVKMTKEGDGSNFKFVY